MSIAPTKRENGIINGYRNVGLQRHNRNVTSGTCGMRHNALFAKSVPTRVGVKPEGRGGRESKQREETTKE